MDGNLFGAAERVASAFWGRSVIYTDETGQRKRAIMLASGVTKERLAMLPIRVTCQLAVSLKEGIDLSAFKEIEHKIFISMLAIIYQFVTKAVLFLLSCALLLTVL